mmetsp:Transcript_31359/g.75109  ORF Transcript_31359/g.75109 Transcript_31359/m.75109 type:complete len:423 (+) Transcript_31359:74-1342(+)
MHRTATFAGHVTSGLAPSPVSALGGIGRKSPDDVVIISAFRTPIGRAKKGAFKDTTPDDLLAAVLSATLKKTGVNPKEVGDVVVGNVQLGGAYAGPARMAQLRAGFPEDVPLHTVNRQCSSGLQAVAHVAAGIKAGMYDCGIGAGVESMTHGGGVNDAQSMPPVNVNELMANPLARDCLVPMGMTAENVAERYGVSREDQDKMGVESHTKALAAQAAGKFNDEIIPVEVTVQDAQGNEQKVTVDKDDGPRATTMEGLGKLKTVFKPKGGTVTAGTSSQVSDGAAAVLLMSRAKADKLGLKPLGCIRSSKVVGVKPDEMGVGPAVAIPAACEAAGVKVDDIDVFEVNEAFAAQALYCVRKLNIPDAKLNPLGGAIALGHPLGCTGARQVATLLHEMKRTNKKLGVVSMCIGTGMGMASVFEAE